MSVTIETLRGYGTRRITMHCSDGTFDGSIVPEHLSEDTVMLLFTLHDEQRPIVIALDGIIEIVER